MSHVLVVAANPAVAETLTDWLSAQGHQTRVVTDFAAAKPELDAHPPDLLVAQVKLGAYNGLHLAIRARSSQIETRSIIIGDPDRVLEADARQQNVCYLTEPLDQRTFEETARQIIPPVH